MPGVTRRQIEQAKEWDLLSFLQAYEPQELKKCGNEYCTVSHDSLKISNGKWHWHSRGIGGRTALDYLMKVRGMDFVAAVETLCGMEHMAEVRSGGGVGYGGATQRATEHGEIKKRAAEHEMTAYEAAKREAVYRAAHGMTVSGTAVSGVAVPTEPPQAFSLPEPNRYGTAMVSYLQERGIDADIISRCIGLGILYEGRKYRNCVFVGRNPEGKARYACIRGIRNSYKREAEGSDKRYGFCLPSRDSCCSSVTVAESPVDVLSLATIRKLQGEDWTADHYLSLGGTAPCALLQFLEDHPAVSRITLCLDQDKAGLLGMEKIRRAFLESEKLAGRVLDVKDAPPPASCGKDYNDLLQKMRASQRGRGGAPWLL